MLDFPRNNREWLAPLTVLCEPLYAILLREETLASGGKMDSELKDMLQREPFPCYFW